MTKGFKILSCYFFVFVIFVSTTNAQIKVKDTTFVQKNAYKSATLSIKDPVSNIKFGGYFRFLGFVRDLPTMYPLDITSYYSGVFPQQTTISVGTGYREPMMLLAIGGTAKRNITFGTDLMLNSSFDGNFENSSISLNLGTNFYSTLESDFGKFKVHAGGISWYRQSKLTVWAEEGYLRYSLFERAPYDPLNKNAVDRYKKYYEQGAIDQDLRFGNVAFQGITFSGNSFPWWFADGVSFQGILGKTQNNIANIVAPGKDDYCFGLRFNKTSPKRNSFSLNYFSSKTATDSTSYLKRSFDISSFEFVYNIKRLSLFGEIGIGSYESANVERSSGEAIIVNLHSPKEYTLVPIRIQYARIAPEAVNVNSSFTNTSVSDLVQTTVIEEGADPTIMTGFGGPVSSLGYLANNREGFSVNTEFEVNDFSVSGGFGFYSELSRINSIFSYNHISTGLILSRISYFSTGYGPYGHLNSYYRGVYENVPVTDSLLVDSLGAPLFDKFYCSSDLHIKYKTRLFNKDLYLFSLTNYNTAQDYFSVLPTFSEDAFIRQFNHQFDVCYSLTPNMSLVLKHALERVVANDKTELDTYDPFPISALGVDLGEQGYVPTYKARDQIGQILGFGLDIQLHDGAFLFLRHSRFSFKDKNFIETNIKGSETTIELKINF